MSGAEGKLSRQGPVASTHLRENPMWYQHYSLQNLPAPPTMEEQREWVNSSEYKQQASQSKVKFNIEPVSIDSLRLIGKNTLAKLSTKSSQLKANQVSSAWTTKMLQSGTLADKISALSLQIKYQPLTFPQYFDSLLSLASRKGHKETNLALEALRDLFMTDIIPLNRKLRYFHDQPWVQSYASYTSAPNRSTIPPLHLYRSEPKADLLAMFFLEDFIKRSYGTYIDTISDQLQTSNLPYMKNHRVKLAFELLAKIPEQETTLLVLIISKFGDSDRAIVSKVQFHLEKLVKSAPALKLPIVKEIERVVFRPHIKQRTQYFAILFITNLLLNKSDLKLAQYLLTMYLTLFQLIVNDALPLINDRQLATQAFIEKNKVYLQKSSKGKRAEMAKKKAKKMTKHQDGGISTKILGAILTGVARCLPYAIPSESQALPEHLKSAEQKAVEAVLVGQMDQLIHCAASTAQTNGNVCVQSLALIWQILSVVKATNVAGKIDNTKKADKNATNSTTATLSRDPFYRVLYSIIQFPQPFTCSRVKIFFNVLFKALKGDTSKIRVLAMVKRLLQISVTVNIQSAASLMYIISNVAETHQFIYNAIQSKEKSEKYIKQDIMTSLQYNQYLQTIAREEKEAKNDSNFKSQYDFVIENPEKINVNGADCYKVNKVRQQFYDPFEGDPLYTHADSSGLFELCMSLSHYHPTLQVWSKNFFNGELIQYAGDPIKDFTPIAFFDNWLRKQSKRQEVNADHGHQPRRLIVDPEVEDYMKDTSNAFISQFVPLYKNRPGYDAKRNYRHESEEDYVDRLMDEELLRLGGRGKDDQFDYEDYDDFEDEYNEEAEGEGGLWGGQLAFDGEGETDFSHFDGFGADFEDEDFEDEDDDSDFDESQLVSLDWDTLDPNKATIAEVSEDEDEPPAPIVTKKATKATPTPLANTKNAKKATKKVDHFADLDLSDLDGQSDGEHNSGMFDGSDDDDDSGDDGADLRDILDDDEAIAELLEEASATATKRDTHAEKMVSHGLGGKATGGSAAKRKEPTKGGKDDNKNKKGKDNNNKNKRQRTKM